MQLELEDTSLSYNEWKASGYYVIKGQKSRDRDRLGIPQFTADQVCRLGGHRTHWEECTSAAQAKSTPWGVVEDFDSFVREAGRLPNSSRRPTFNITNPLEMHLMNVADKHGILEAIIDGDEDDYY